MAIKTKNTLGGWAAWLESGRWNGLCGKCDFDSLWSAVDSSRINIYWYSHILQQNMYKSPLTHNHTPPKL